MKIRSQLVVRALAVMASAALPLVLLYSSLRTFHEIDEQRQVYLRHRVALLAARLESVPEGSTHEAVIDAMSQEEPNLVDLEVIERGSATDTAALSPLWDGQELFRTENVQVANAALFRAYVPFHSAAGLRLARIDLNAAAADFLVVHARHNVIVASVSGLVLAVLSITALWAVRRAALMRERQLEMEHLAHVGKMAAVLAHEIRNPLGTIKGFMQLAGERTDEATRALLTPALAETTRLETLVNDLLAYGRPPHPQPRMAAWSEIAMLVAQHGRRTIGERPIRLIVAEGEMEFETDPALFGQALLNLVRNAIEAIPAEGEVRIDVRRDAAAVAVTVADTGPGISEEALARLCEPFFTTKAFGTGLGLAITRKILDSLGAELRIARRVEGGTEATIWKRF